LVGVLPYLTRKLGVDAKMYGYLLSFFSFAQLCGGPLFGRFGDLCGGKWALVLAFFASFVSYAGLSLVSTIPFLFLSRLPTIAMHGMQGCHWPAEKNPAKIQYICDDFPVILPQFFIK
jgi:OCT family organic cation transporter-like MFS transporter 18